MISVYLALLCVPHRETESAISPSKIHIFSSQIRLHKVKGQLFGDVSLTVSGKYKQTLFRHSCEVFKAAYGATVLFKVPVSNHEVHFVLQQSDSDHKEIAVVSIREKGIKQVFAFSTRGSLSIQQTNYGYSIIESWDEYQAKSFGIIDELHKSKRGTYFREMQFRRSSNSFWIN